MKFLQKGGTELAVIIIVFIFAVLMVKFNPLSMFQSVSNDQQSESTDAVKTATSYTDALIAACPSSQGHNTGYVTIFNNACVKKIINNTIIPKANMFVQELLEIRHYGGTTVLQCAGYMIILSDVFGKPLEPHNAWEYDTNGNHYKYYTYLKNNGINKIHPGDFVVWNRGGGDGHIAYVQSVNANGSAFLSLGANEVIDGIPGYVYKDAIDYLKGGNAPSGWLEPLPNN